MIKMNDPDDHALIDTIAYQLQTVTGQEPQLMYEE